MKKSWNELDAEVLGALNKIDWSSVSEFDAQSIGISLGLYSDNLIEKHHARDLFNRSILLVFSVLAISFIALKIRPNEPIVMFIGVLSTLIINSILLFGRLVTMRSLTSLHKQQVLSEMIELENKHTVSDGT